MLCATELRPPSYLPKPPASIRHIDVPEHLLIDLAVRHLYQRGICSVQWLCTLMKVPLEVAEAIYRKLNDQQYLELRPSAGDDYVFSLSAPGRRFAIERSQTFRYTGPTPVSMRAYNAAVRAQVPHARIDRSQLREAFSDIVLPDELLDQLGPALISQRSLFLYGPSGTGKTTISERLGRVYQDTVAVPWAIEADGQIITVADPAVHEQVEFEGMDYDRRWLICRRPFLAAGGELVTGMLDLRHDEISGSFVAPLQMKANNGILLIDDFGRQMMSPRDLLNRWIVPLDRRVDFLSLGSGKLDIPFELMVVFSTNLEPHELADDAFLRRIPNKILIQPIDADSFDAIFRLSAAAAGLDHDADTAGLCRELCLARSPDLRPCFPRDICEAIRAILLYEHRPPTITPADLERAAAGYFAVSAA